MGSRGVVTLYPLLLLMAAMSGCLSESVDDASTSPDEVFVYEPTDMRECFEYDDIERCWLIHIPTNTSLEYCQEHSCPLLIDLHGRNVPAALQNNLSDFARVTDVDHTVLVHPEGIGLGWNFGWCCGEEDDVGFLLTLIDHMIENRSVDDSRVYMSGWSNGCFMSQEMAMAASHKITAIACMAGYTEEPKSTDYSPIPVMEFHGFLDSGVLYGHSSTASLQVAGTLEGDEGAIQNLYWWADANGCSGIVPDFETVESDHSIKKFTECENGSQAVLYTLNFAQHNPYLNDYEGADGPFNEATLKGNPTGLDITATAWEFLRAFNKDVEVTNYSED